MNANRARRRLREGHVVSAITVNPLSASLAEQAATFGFDCVVADGEHGPVDDDRLEDMARAADLMDVSCAIRLASAAPLVASLRRYLEMGISTVQITQIQSAEQAQEVVDAVKYPPAGKRGAGPNARALEYGRLAATGRMGEFMEFSNQETLVIISIEDDLGLAALPDILRVDGIDVVMPGEFDLSTVFGIPGQVQHPRVQAALEEIGRRTIEAGRVYGRGAHTPQDVDRVVALGARFILTAVTKQLSLAAVPLVERAGSVLETAAS